MPLAVIRGARFERLPPAERGDVPRGLGVSAAPPNGWHDPSGAVRIGQTVLVVALVAIFLLGLIFTVVDKLERVGQPDIGFLTDGRYVSPTRHDSSDAGLRGGGRAISVNGVGVSPVEGGSEQLSGVHRELGATNLLTLERPGGAVRNIAVEVRPWGWHDVLFTEGGTGLVGLLIFAVGASVFALRPFEPTSWALLSLASFGGGALVTTFVPIAGDQNFAASIYFRFIVGVICWVPFHLMLAFPVPHPLLRRRWVLWLVYGLAVLSGVMNIVAWRLDFAGPLLLARPINAIVLFAATMLFVARCARYAFRESDPLVRQRAGILLAGAVLGLGPVVLLQVVQQAFHGVGVDIRFAYWALGIFVLSLSRVTIRPEILNARIAVRRALIYATVVGVLTLLAIALLSVRPYAVAVLLLPLLYLWPRFDARLNARLYPQRARFPELLREIGDDLSTCTTIEHVLDALTRAPRRLCDARRSLAFLLPSATSPAGFVRSSDGDAPVSVAELGEEPIVALLRAMRKEIVRDQISVEPQYSNIEEECHAGFRRLRAELLLPILQDGRVVGGLAIDARMTDDVYQAAEIDALSTVAQQGAQALLRVQATERLHAREHEFADLKRFLSPQIIDQVMARGGAAELRSQRRLVTVLFADMRGFTSFSESVEPEEVMATLAEYHAAMGRRIAEHAGTLERFAGDGFMVFFNDPVEQPDHAERAVRMALAMHDDLKHLREAWNRQGYAIDVGMGIDTGYATCGFVGYEGRRDYGVIGKVTNLAARLSDAAAPGEILITARVAAQLNGHLRAEPIGALALKGFAQPQTVYRLAAIAGV